MEITITIKATISKDELKARMLEIFREVEESGQELIVTDNGKPVLKITPIKEKATVEEVFGKYFGRSSITKISTPQLSMNGVMSR